VTPGVIARRLTRVFPSRTDVNENAEHCGLALQADRSASRTDLEAREARRDSVQTFPVQPYRVTNTPECSELLPEILDEYPLVMHGHARLSGPGTTIASTARCTVVVPVGVESAHHHSAGGCWGRALLHLARPVNGSSPAMQADCYGSWPEVPAGGAGVRTPDLGPFSASKGAAGMRCRSLRVAIKGPADGCVPSAGAGSGGR
jgi:hypothetical protein